MVEKWKRTVNVEFQVKCKDFDEFKIRWPNYFAEYNSKVHTGGWG